MTPTSNQLPTPLAHDPLRRTGTIRGPSKPSCDWEGSLIPRLAGPAQVSRPRTRPLTPLVPSTNQCSPWLVWDPTGPTRLIQGPSKPSWDWERSICPARPVSACLTPTPDTQNENYYMPNTLFTCLAPHGARHTLFNASHEVFLLGHSDILGPSPPSPLPTAPGSRPGPTRHHSDEHDLCMRPSLS